MASITFAKETSLDKILARGDILDFGLKDGTTIFTADNTGLAVTGALTVNGEDVSQLIGGGDVLPLFTVNPTSSVLELDSPFQVKQSLSVDSDAFLGSDLFVAGNVFLGLQNATDAGAPSTVFVGDAWGEAALVTRQISLINDLTTTFAVAGKSVFVGDIELEGNLSQNGTTINLSQIAEIAPQIAEVAPKVENITTSGTTTTVAGDLTVTGTITGEVRVVTKEVVKTLGGSVSINLEDQGQSGTVAHQHVVRGTLTASSSTITLAGPTHASLIRLLIVAKGWNAGYTKATELMVAFDGTTNYTPAEMSANTASSGNNPITIEYATTTNAEGEGLLKITAKQVPEAGDVNVSALVVSMGNIKDQSAPPAPTNLQATFENFVHQNEDGTFDGTVIYTFNDSLSSDVAAYNFKLVDGSSEVSVANVSSGDSYQFTNLNTGATLSITAVDNAGNVSAPAQITLNLTDGREPLGPTDFSVITSDIFQMNADGTLFDATFALQFTDSISPDVARYDLYADDVKVSEGVSSGDSVTLTGLAQNAVLVVKSVDHAGKVSGVYPYNQVTLDLVDDSPPPRPVINSVTAGDTTAIINFIAPDAVEARVFFSPDGGANFYFQGHEILNMQRSNEAREITVDGLNNGTQYTFQVQSKDSAGRFSSFSSSVTAPAPLETFNTSGSDAGNQTLQISFSGPLNAGDGKYDVYISTSTDFTGVSPNTMDPTDGTEETYYFTVATGTYYFKVQAKNTGGYGAFSNTSTAIDIA